MGRLFWKLFLAIFLAQLLTAWGVGVLFWLSRPAYRERSAEDASGHRPLFRSRPPPREAGPRQSADEEGMDPDSRPPPESSANEQDRWREKHSEPRPEASEREPREHREEGPPHGIPWQPVAIGFVASLLFAALLARHLSRPIVALRKAFDEVALGRFERLAANLPRFWADELSDLASDFDRTADRVKMLIHNQRRLLHDVSHEVRSPLARMQLAIDLARQNPDKTAETMVRLERESGRINRLVEELLTLSRLEAGACGNLEEDVDLPELLNEIVEDARFEATTKQCQVTLDSIDRAVIHGHAGLLQRAIENVVRNAIRHTAEHSTIAVALSRDGNELSITVEDCGPGVPENALHLIFDPFVRLQQTGNEGYGLGLAITRQTIETHGGHVEASNRKEGGLRMEMRLPVNTSV